MSNNTIYQTSPSYARPPLDAESNRRVQQSNNNANSGHSALGNAMLNGDMSDDDDDENPFTDGHGAPAPVQQPIPLAAPKPGYAAPVAALNLASPTTPSPSASPVGRQPSPSQGVRPLMLVNNMNGIGSGPNSPRMPSPGISVPSTPHPLPPTITPIQPAFVRPNKVVDDRDVKFAPSTPILRGEKEETLLPRRGERGDDFWRRFSMVVKQERMLPQSQKESAWLRKTQNGSTRLARWVWIVGLILLIVIVAAIALGVYISSKNQSHNAPTAFGGSANEKLQTGTDTVHASITNGGGIEHSSSRHVSPTATVARRDEYPEVTALPASPVLVHERSSFENSNLVRAIPPSRHRRAHHNRSET